jgi:hypothetical protein
MTRFERDWSDRILPVLTERDPFRFVIRAQVLIEDVLEEGIDTALPAGTPGELKGLRLRARLALAEALELLTADHVGAITALAKIRNEFAHGLRDDFTKADAEAMAAAVCPFLGDVFNVSDYSEGDAVRIAVRIVWQVNAGHRRLCAPTTGTSGHTSGRVPTGPYAHARRSHGP